MRVARTHWRAQSETMCGGVQKPARFAVRDGVVASTAAPSRLSGASPITRTRGAAHARSPAATESLAQSFGDVKESAQRNRNSICLRCFC